MDLVVVQILTAVLVFSALVAFSYLPYCFIQCRRRGVRKKKRDERFEKGSVPVLSLCNCFAAGIFLATCFLGMVPHVREHVAEWYRSASATNENGSKDNNVSAAAFRHSSAHKMPKTVPWTEILLIGGFLMILIIEEFMKFCQQHCGWCGRKSTGVKFNHNIDEHAPRISTSAEDEPLMSDDEPTSGIQLTLGGGSKHVLDSPVHVQRRPTTGDCHSHSSGGHSHHDAALLLSDNGRSISWRSVALLLGLGIHGVFEGVALGLQDTTEDLLSLLVGIMSHEMLCAIAFGINLAGHRARAGVAFMTVVLFSLSIPTGMMAGFVVNRSKSDASAGQLIRIVLEGLAAGTFVYVAFMDMLAHELNTDDHQTTVDRWRLPKVLCVCAGFALFLWFTLIT